MTGTQLFQILKPRTGQREAEAIIDYVDTTIKENNGDMHETFLRILTTKEDLANVRGELKGDIANLRGELKEDIARVEGRLETKIAEVKSDVIRWTFAFFVTLMLAILGLYLKK
jgi:hypothetical protein